ncbi:MAG: hypothetical protein MNPFHGCM_01374 [Gemmatimonadaceae bacterium]|nr:hypothetical protein [Gemmatimonadaceae bacterium]
MFRFPLQRLLDLRAQREQALARELVTAQEAAEAEHQRHDALASARDSAHARVSQAAAEGPTVGQLVSLNYAAAQLSERADAAQEAAVAADAHARDRRDALSSAAMDRQILDRLRTRREDEYRADQAHAERATMDAVALARHTHGDAAKRKENEA